MWSQGLWFENKQTLLHGAAITRAQITFTPWQDWVNCVFYAIYLVFYWIFCGVIALIRSSASVSFICFGFLMLLSWIWILNFHQPARQQDCQTPQSMRMKRIKQWSVPTYTIRYFAHSMSLCSENKNQGILFSLRILQPKLFPTGSVWKEF